MACLQEVSTPAGQLAYATPEQLASKGLTEEDRAPAKLLAKPPTQLLTPVEELCDAFWSGSEWGKGQVRQLEQQPFDPSTGSRSALTKQRYANGWFKLMKLTLKRQVRWRGCPAASTGAMASCQRSRAAWLHHLNAVCCPHTPA